MNISSLTTLVTRYAPLLGSIIGSANPISGMVVNLIAELFGADPKNPEDMIAKISADPDAAMKLKQLEYQHQEALQKTETEDRISARQREENMVKITGKPDYALNMIAFVVIFGYFSMCGIVAFTKMDNTDHDILYMLIGQLTGGFVMVLSFFFGASKKQ